MKFILAILLILNSCTVIYAEKTVAIKYSPFDCTNCNLFIRQLVASNFKITIVMQEELKSADTSDLEDLHMLIKNKKINISFNDNIYNQFSKTGKSNVGILNEENILEYEFKNPNKEIEYNKIDSLLMSNNFCLESGNKKGKINPIDKNHLEFTNIISKKKILLSNDCNITDVEQFLPKNFDSIYYLKTLKDTLSFKLCSLNTEYSENGVVKIISINNNNIKFFYKKTVVELGKDNHSRYYKIATMLVEIENGALKSIYPIDYAELIKDNKIVNISQLIYINDTVIIPIHSTEKKSDYYSIARFALNNNKYNLIKTTQYELPNSLIKSNLYHLFNKTTISNEWLINSNWNYTTNIKTNKKIIFPIPTEDYLLNTNYIETQNPDDVKFLMFDIIYNNTFNYFTFFYLKNNEIYVSRFYPDKKDNYKIVNLKNKVQLEINNGKTLSYDGSRIIFIKDGDKQIQEYPIDHLFN